MDPLNIGVNPNMLGVLNRYPSGNDPAFGQDGGLNFSGFRFNAPSHRNDKAIVGKMDFHLDRRRQAHALVPRHGCTQCG